MYQILIVIRTISNGNPALTSQIISNETIEGIEKIIQNLSEHYATLPTLKLSITRL